MHAQFEAEVKALMSALHRAGEFRAGSAVRAAFEKIRARIAFLSRDRALDGDIRAICALVEGGLLH
jgi:histidine ammonia-lyase